MQVFWKRWTTGVALFVGIAVSGMADASEEPLPPLGTPLAEIVDDLAWRAARGEPVAACRLAMELAVCALDLPAARSRIIMEPASFRTDADRAAFADSQRRVREAEERREAELKAHCAGAPIVSPEVLLAAFRRAALLGSLEAMRRYVGANRWMLKEWPLTGREATAWKANALSVRWALLRAGDVSIAERLWSDYLHIPESQRIPNPLVPELMDGLHEDLVKASALLRYFVAVRKAANAEPSRREQSWLRDHEEMIAYLDLDMAPQQRPQARALAAEWLATINRLPERDATSDERWVTGSVSARDHSSHVAACDLVIEAPEFQAP